MIGTSWPLPAKTNALNLAPEWEKVALMETLSQEERRTIYTMLDAFVGKKKLKDALSGVLKDVE